MIVQTITGQRGAVIRRTPYRVYVRLWLTLPGIGPARGIQRPPARVVVAYAPEDVREVRGTREEHGSILRRAAPAE